MRILFVCLGNICRSPMAEILFADMVLQRGLAVAVSSAGTSGWHDGEPMHIGTATVLAQLGLDTSRFRSRMVSDDDWAEADYVLAMDDGNLKDLRARFGSHAKLLKISDLWPDCPYDHIPDPYYTGNFGETRDLLQHCCAALLEKLVREGVPQMIGQADYR